MWELDDVRKIASELTGRLLPDVRLFQSRACYILKFCVTKECVQVIKAVLCFSNFMAKTCSLRIVVRVEECMPMKIH